MISYRSWIVPKSLLALCLSLTLWSDPVESAVYQFVPFSKAQAHWIDILQQPPLRSLPEARLLLRLLQSSQFQTIRRGGVLSPTWFSNIENGKLLINEHEYNSLARMFSLYADATKKRLKRVTRTTLFHYWTGGWSPWLWHRIFAIKLLPGLLHAVARLRFRNMVRKRLTWFYPLETQEEVLAGLLTQIRFFQQLRNNTAMNAGWNLFRFGRLDRAYQRLWRVWKTGGVQGIHSWHKTFASRPTSVLSPTYSLYPITAFFRITLSKKRPPFQLNRKHMDSLLWKPRSTLRQDIISEIKLLQNYLSFIQQKVPVKIEKIITKRLKRMGISRSERRAELFAALWRRQLRSHYNNNLLVQRFKNKQRINRRALKILKNPTKHKQLQQAYQQALYSWWKKAPPPVQASGMEKRKKEIKIVTPPRAFPSPHR